MVVGNGKPHHAKMFAQDDPFPFPLWVDPRRNAYRALGLRRGVGEVFNTRGIKHFNRAFRGGFRQGWTQGDPWQNGGVFVITPQEQTLLEQVSAESGDHATVAQILGALDGAQAVVA